MKPDKKLYEDQGKVWNEAAKHLQSLLSGHAFVKEAHVWASLAEGRFGIYKSPFKGEKASDIDLVVVVKEPFKLPKEWKFTGVQKSWFDLYRLGHFDYEGNRHRIDGLVVIPSRHDLGKMREALKGRSKQLRV